jgi:hypothetical protein
VTLRGRVRKPVKTKLRIGKTINGNSEEPSKQTTLMTLSLDLAPPPLYRQLGYGKYLPVPQREKEWPFWLC